MLPKKRDSGMKAANVLTILLVLCLVLEIAFGEVEKKWWRRRKRKRCHPTNCEVSQWCQWSHCSQSCGDHGRQTRTRHVTRHQKCGGRCHYTLSEVRPCNRVCFNGGVWRSNKCHCTSGYAGECCQVSKKVPVNGCWSKWSPWSPPSKTCGGIVINGRYRTRTCTNPSPANDGRYCMGPSRQFMTLFLPKCPVQGVDGGWSSWTPWCKCSKSCGPGLQYRKRTCTHPKPSNGGRPCQGKCKDMRTCHLAPCMPSYQHKGCYKDSPSRALPDLLGVYTGHHNAVFKCAAKTFHSQYKCFGVQNGGECWSGPNAHNTYYIYNKCSKCHHGNGGPYANDVYCFSGESGMNPVTTERPITVRKTLKPTTKPTLKPTAKLTFKPTTKATASPNCWSDWVYSECTRPCGCGTKARVRYCQCGEGKHGSCQGLPMETFKCNCHQCGPPVDAFN